MTSSAAPADSPTAPVAASPDTSSDVPPDALSDAPSDAPSNAPSAASPTDSAAAETPDSLALIRTLLARDHDVPPERLTRDASLETLGVDSLGIMELLWNLEDELGITLPTDRTDLHTLGEVADYVDELVVEQRAPHADDAGA